MKNIRRNVLVVLVLCFCVGIGIMIGQCISFKEKNDVIYKDESNKLVEKDNVVVDKKQTSILDLTNMVDQTDNIKNLTQKDFLLVNHGLLSKNLYYTVSMKDLIKYHEEQGETPVELIVQRKNVHNRYIYIYQYKGITYFLYDLEEKLDLNRNPDNIVLTDNTYQLISSIGVGDSVEQVLLAYGNDFIIDEETDWRIQKYMGAQSKYDETVDYYCQTTDEDRLDFGIDEGNEMYNGLKFLVKDGKVISIATTIPGRE